MKVNDIVSVLTSLGTEYVGKFKSMDTNGIMLEDPKLVTMSEQGMGFAGGIAMTGNPDPKQVLINLSQIVFVTETNEMVVKAYRKATSGIIT
jgi:hypothetical protein